MSDEKKPAQKATVPAEDGSILKYIAGAVLGILITVVYTRLGFTTPAILEIPGKLKGNVISSAAEYDLYDLTQPMEVRERALEVFFGNRSKFAVEVDAEFDHLFLESLYRKRVIREARQLRMQWSAYDTALEKPALREVYERKYGTDETIALKQSMLMNAYQEKEFLVEWVKRNREPVTHENLLQTLEELSRSE